MTDAEKGAIAAAEGHCLCGKVSIRLHQAKRVVDVCHCAMCRRWGGGPFMGMSGDSFEISGEDDVTSYPSSNWAERAFCKNCGSNLWYRFTPTDHYSFTAGVFDIRDGIEIEQQIFVDEKPAFYDFSQETPMKTGAEIIAEAEASGLSFD